jgi:hypothetical protein
MWVHDLVERLMDGGKLLIPGTGLSIIERVFRREPGRQGNQDALRQAAHKRLIGRSQLGQLLLADCAFLQPDARGLSRT